MAFVTIGIQGDNRYLLVDDQYIDQEDDGPRLSHDAEGFVFDKNPGTASEMMPVASIIAHGHGMWDIRNSLSDESDRFPDAQSLLEQYDLNAPQPLEHE